jgi:hypothetical protein
MLQRHAASGVAMIAAAAAAVRGTRHPAIRVFQGNVRPDTNQPFDVGIGVHKSQLEQFAYAGYDGGLLCLTITGGTIAQLNTDTFGLLSRSLGKLVEGNSQMAVGLRPQSPPTIVLGRNIFTDDGMNKTLTSRCRHQLHRARSTFHRRRCQYIRTFTVVSDAHFLILARPRWASSSR